MIAMLMLALRVAQSVCSGATPFNNTLTNLCVADCPWDPPNRYFGNPNNNFCESTCTWGYGLTTTQRCVSACPFTPS
jgi:hypothetical protein